MTTPAQDAPLVFPAVAFRPVRLFVISVAVTAVATLIAAYAGHAIVGAFFILLIYRLIARRRP